MERENNLKPPVGAVWVRGNKLKNNIRDAFINMLNEHQVKFSTDEVDKLLSVSMVPHTLSVKVNTYLDEGTGERKEIKEKFIAIQNRNKKRDTQPDYFLHTYQTHTGATPEYPWGYPGSKGTEISVENIGSDGDVREDGGEQSEKTGVQLREKDVCKESNADEASAHITLGGKCNTGSEGSEAGENEAEKTEG